MLWTNPLACMKEDEGLNLWSKFKHEGVSDLVSICIPVEQQSLDAHGEV